ncbi:unnamed protein product [Vitrella brassicaformis CCMP3155]|uniref:Uncharacterized protein n=2 Tax=Vitrella brassicaformis TaxID=1169539 RepID=A0A0G4FN07_VITBC|nr:unnamed protein product [Vitrella brassicaformis CCMP3155]|mmetsp:Transcript_34258/g.84840  ORF Transcript_34258/g.84840 Transcript_34258/m.84840 type:complete len:1148 (+) Transcript_34258:93-3536(+)|eukprot:CEM15565.1 unnamed protein product [Vitrella brassicaformis CCMP3155]
MPGRSSELYARNVIKHFGKDRPGKLWSAARMVWRPWTDPAAHETTTHTTWTQPAGWQPKVAGGGAAHPAAAAGSTASGVNAKGIETEKLLVHQKGVQDALQSVATDRPVSDTIHLPANEPLPLAPQHPPPVPVGCTGVKQRIDQLRQESRSHHNAGAYAWRAFFAGMSDVKRALLNMDGRLETLEKQQKTLLERSAHAAEALRRLEEASKAGGAAVDVAAVEKGVRQMIQEETAHIRREQKLANDLLVRIQDYAERMARQSVLVQDQLTTVQSTLSGYGSPILTTLEQLTERIAQLESAVGKVDESVQGWPEVFERELDQFGAYLTESIKTRVGELRGTIEEGKGLTDTDMAQIGDIVNQEMQSVTSENVTWRLARHWHCSNRFHKRLKHWREQLTQQLDDLTVAIHNQHPHACALAHIEDAVKDADVLRAKPPSTITTTTSSGSEAATTVTATATESEGEAESSVSESDHEPAAHHPWVIKELHKKASELESSIESTEESFHAADEKVRDWIRQMERLTHSLDKTSKDCDAIAEARRTAEELEMRRSDLEDAREDQMVVLIEKQAEMEDLLRGEETQHHLSDSSELSDGELDPDVSHDMAGLQTLEGKIATELDREQEMVSSIEEHLAALDDVLQQMKQHLAEERAKPTSTTVQLEDEYSTTSDEEGAATTTDTASGASEGDHEAAAEKGRLARIIADMNMKPGSVEGATVTITKTTGGQDRCEKASLLPMNDNTIANTTADVDTPPIDKPQTIEHGNGSLWGMPWEPPKETATPPATTTAKTGAAAPAGSLWGMPWQPKPTTVHQPDAATTTTTTTGTTKPPTSATKVGQGLDNTVEFDLDVDHFAPITSRKRRSARIGHEPFRFGSGPFEGTPVVPRDVNVTAHPHMDMVEVPEVPRRATARTTPLPTLHTNGGGTSWPSFSRPASEMGRSAYGFPCVGGLGQRKGQQDGGGRGWNMRKMQDDSAGKSSFESLRPASSAGTSSPSLSTFPATPLPSDGCWYHPEGADIQPNDTTAAAATASASGAGAPGAGRESFTIAKDSKNPFCCNRHEGCQEGQRPEGCTWGVGAKQAEELPSTTYITTDISHKIRDLLAEWKASEGSQPATPVRKGARKSAWLIRSWKQAAAKHCHAHHHHSSSSGQADI